MAEKNLNETPAPETLADGSTVERDTKGEIVKITDALGAVYEPKTISLSANAETVRMVEDYRWPRKMKVSEVIQAALNDYIVAKATPKA